MTKKNLPIIRPKTVKYVNGKITLNFCSNRFTKEMIYYFFLNVKHSSL